MGSNPFAQAENEYFRLKGQHATGRISREQLEAALQDLMVQDEQGRWWIMGVDSAKWYVNEGGSWVEANPYGVGAPVPSMPSRPPNLPERGYAPGPPAPMPAPGPIAPAPAPVARSKGGGCGGCILPGCLGLLVFLVVLGGGGFLAYSSGALTLNTLLNVAGMGPGDIQVTNFRDDALQVSFTLVDPSRSTPPSPRSLALNPFDVKSYRATNPGRYRVEFRTARGSTALGTCMLTVRSGDQFQFVALPERIAIQRANSPSNTGRDFVINTSSLCR